MIPRLLHFVWVGGPMPARLRRFVQSWATVHPDWDVRMWGDDDLGWLQNFPLFNAADVIAGRYAGQLMSDIARIEILHRHGGVYVDCDFEALRPIDDLCATTDAWMAWEVNGVWANNAIMASPAGHPLWAELIEQLPDNVHKHRKSRPNVMSGPHFLTPRVVGRKDVTIHPAELFYPYLHNELHRQGEDFPNAYAVHHWGNTRRRKGQEGWVA